MTNDEVVGLRIIFGWEYDLAPWGQTTETGTVVAGPLGLAGILATRFGLAQPETPSPLRIARYRRAVDRFMRGHHESDAVPWFAGSFRNDPWGSARELLRWRDDLVSAGWTGAAADLGQGAELHRLRALAAIEALLPAGLDGIAGAADTLRDIATHLCRMVREGPAWNTGIDTIELDLPPGFTGAGLPGLWPGVLNALESLGVNVELVPQADPARVDLAIITPDSEWDAATAGARIISDHLGEPFTVITGASTQLLDLELMRHGAPRAGLRGGIDARVENQVLRSFLSAVTAPLDLQALLAFLDQTCTDPAGGEPVSIMPPRIRSRIHQALTKEPGLGGPAWREMIVEATSNGPAGDAAILAEFDQILRYSPLEPGPGGALPTADVLELLDWFAGRLRALMGTRAPAVSRAAGHVASVSTVLRALGDDVSEPELAAIVEECVMGGSAELVEETSATMRVVTTVGGLGRGEAPVVWWVPVDQSPAPEAWHRPQEAERLAASGVHLPDREKLTRLRVQSQLMSIRRRSQVTAILPREVGGGPAEADPVLTFLIQEAKTQKTTGEETFEDAARRLTHTITDRFPALTITPTRVDLPHRDPVVIDLPPGEHLLPSRISFSSWERLLARPIEWVLDSQLQIRESRRSDIPTGPRAIGNWFHKAIENIVKRHLEGSEPGEAAFIELAEGEAKGELTELRPFFMSELDLPGRERDRSGLVAEGTKAIEKLFMVLSQAEIKVSGAEERIIGATVEGVLGAGGEALPLVGFRDLDVLLPDGRRGVIDLKYSPPGKLREMLRQGTALQLTVYGRSLAGGEVSLRSVPTGYFTLRGGGDLLTMHEEFGVEPVWSKGGAYSVDELWERAARSLEDTLERLRAGVVYELAKTDKKERDSYLKEARKNPDVCAPWPPEVAAAIERLDATGFLPWEKAKYPDFALITGTEEA